MPIKKSSVVSKKSVLIKSMLSIKAAAKNVHVISQNHGWAVKSEGSTRADKAFDDKTSAIRRAKTIALKTERDVVVHKKDGTVDTWHRPGENGKSR